MITNNSPQNFAIVPAPQGDLVNTQNSFPRISGTKIHKKRVYFSPTFPLPLVENYKLKFRLQRDFKIDIFPTYYICSKGREVSPQIAWPCGDPGMKTSFSHIIRFSFFLHNIIIHTNKDDTCVLHLQLMHIQISYMRQVGRAAPHM